MTHVDGSSIRMNVKYPSGFVNRKVSAKLCVKAQVSAYAIRSISGGIHGSSLHQLSPLGWEIKDKKNYFILFFFWLEPVHVERS